MIRLGRGNSEGCGMFEEVFDLVGGKEVRRELLRRRMAGSYLN